MAIPNSRGYTADWVRIFPLPALVAYRKTNEPSQHNGEGFENTTIQPGHHPSLSLLINSLFDKSWRFLGPAASANQSTSNTVVKHNQHKVNLLESCSLSCFTSKGLRNSCALGNVVQILHSRLCTFKTFQGSRSLGQGSQYTSK